MRWNRPAATGLSPNWRFTIRAYPLTAPEQGKNMPLWLMKLSSFSSLFERFAYLRDRCRKVDPVATQLLALFS